MLIHVLIHLLKSKECTGLLLWLSSKESTCNAGDTGSIPGSGKCPGEGNGNPLQYSCLESPQRSLGWCIVCGVLKQLDMT